MQTDKLMKGYSIFGNKGAVWTESCHIAPPGMSGTTLCGTPMLSNNWARIDGIEKIGCKECIRLYEEVQNAK